MRSGFLTLMVLARKAVLAVKIDQDTDCDTSVGFDFLQSLRNHNVTLCGQSLSSGLSGSSSARVRPLYVSSAIRLHALPQEPGCGRTETHISVLENARLVISESANPANPGRRSVLAVACEDHGLSRLQDYDRGELEVQALGVGVNDKKSIDSLSCETWVEEDTVLVANPRKEYLQNYYHTMEEIFSIFETAFVLNRPVEDFRYVFLWGPPGQNPELLQLPSQVGLREQTLPPAALPAIFDLWSKFVARPNSAKTQNQAPMVALSAPKPGGPPLCFRRITFPMRACSGSILPATWSTSVPCAHGNRLAKAVAERLRQSFKPGIPSQRLDKRPVVTLVARNSSHSRAFVNEQAIVDALSGLPSQPHLRRVLLGELSITQQVGDMMDTDLLVAVHGAGLAHLVELPETAGVLELTAFPPPYYQRSVANIFANMAKWTSHPYKAVAAKENIDGSLSVEAQEVARAATELLSTRFK